MEGKIFFQPFVGKDYANGGIFGKRILVLGESHYCDAEECEDCGNLVKHQDCNDYTSRVTMGNLLYGDHTKHKWIPTFTRFEHSLIGKEADQEMREKIWSSVIFYNYLQVAMPKPGQAGTKEQYQEGEDAFFEVLEKYCPEYVIVWSKRLWNYLPGDKEGFKAGDAIELDNLNAPTGSYTLKSGHQVKIIAVNHPCRWWASDSCDKWHEIIMEFLK